MAHVVQADTPADIMTLRYPLHQAVDNLNLQVFYELAEAEEWLRSCQFSAAPLPALVPY